MMEWMRMAWVLIPSVAVSLLPVHRIAWGSWAPGEVRRPRAIIGMERMHRAATGG